MNKKNKIILDLCGGSGSWSEPYKKAGYTVKVITLPKYNVTDYVVCDNEIRFFINGTVYFEKILIKNIYGILAAPPCTMFSLARTTAKTPRDLKQGMETVKACLNIIWEIRYKTKISFWALENPRGYLRQFLGKPVFSFDPCDFGDCYTKKTDLWGYFKIPKKNPIKLTKEQIERCKINNRVLPKVINGKISDKRAITPKGFSEAFFKANKLSGGD